MKRKMLETEKEQKDTIKKTKQQKTIEDLIRELLKVCNNAKQEAENYNKFKEKVDKHKKAAEEGKADPEADPSYEIKIEIIKKKDNAKKEYSVKENYGQYVDYQFVYPSFLPWHYHLMCKMVEETIDQAANNKQEKTIKITFPDFGCGTGRYHPVAIRALNYAKERYPNKTFEISWSGIDVSENMLGRFFCHLQEKYKEKIKVTEQKEEHKESREMLFSTMPDLQYDNNLYFKFLEITEEEQKQPEALEQIKKAICDKNGFQNAFSIFGAIGYIDNKIIRNKVIKWLCKAENSAFITLPTYGHLKVFKAMTTEIQEKLKQFADKKIDIINNVMRVEFRDEDYKEHKVDIPIMQAQKLYANLEEGTIVYWRESTDERGIKWVPFRYHLFSQQELEEVLEEIKNEDKTCVTQLFASNIEQEKYLISNKELIEDVAEKIKNLLREGEENKEHVIADKEINFLKTRLEKILGKNWHHIDNYEDMLLNIQNNFSNLTSNIEELTKNITEKTNQIKSKERMVVADRNTRDIMAVQTLTNNVEKARFICIKMVRRATDTSSSLSSIRQTQS